jgi:hypothetical protein
VYLFDWQLTCQLLEQLLRNRPVCVSFARTTSFFKQIVLNSRHSMRLCHVIVVQLEQLIDPATWSAESCGHEVIDFISLGVVSNVHYDVMTGGLTEEQ